LYQLKQNVENALVVIVKDVVSQGAVLGSVSETQHIVLQHGLKTFAKGEGAVNEAGAEEAIDDGQIGADDIVAVGRSVIDNDVVTFLNFPRETGHGVMRPATLDIE